jgi:hypothetical protein
LQGVVGIFYDNDHLLLKHIRGNFKELHNPPWFLASSLAGLSVEDHVANFNVNEW